jgi:Rieske Fe-S protein
MRGPTGASADSMFDRRTVVGGAAGVAAVCAVAACGAGGATGTPATAEGAVPTTVVGNGSAGTKLGPAAAVPVGGGTVYQDLEVVVTQPEAGRFEGLSAVCTHTGCIVDKVASGLIECPCHGSRYHLDGTVARGPAPRALTPRPVTVVAGTIVLT